MKSFDRTHDADDTGRSRYISNLLQTRSTLNSLDRIVDCHTAAKRGHRVVERGGARERGSRFLGRMNPERSLFFPARIKRRCLQNRRRIFGSKRDLYAPKPGAARCRCTD